MSAFYQMSGEAAALKLNSSLQGLKEESIAGRLQVTGKNVLTGNRPRSRLAILAAQFKDVMIVILLVAGIVSFLMGEKTDALIILAIVVANAAMGYTQEYHADRAMLLLKTMTSRYALVIRSQSTRRVLSEELVPGDVIMVAAGDLVPADARLIDENAFETDESSLTGESAAIKKNAGIIFADRPNPADQRNMIFKGSLVQKGSASAIVTGTGMNTEIGRIAGMIQAPEGKTPLQRKLTFFSKQLAVAVIVICLITFLIGIARGEPTLLMFMTALSLAVAALPEALPAIVTIALAAAAKRMAGRKALVRKLHAVETLGCVTVICTDKTGTLTQNKMTVQKTQAVNGSEDRLKAAMLLSNEVKFSGAALIGDSTETALVSYALATGPGRIQTIERFPLVRLFPFDSDRMRMATLHKTTAGFILFVKGAPAHIVRCLAPGETLTANAWLKTNESWAAEGLRVLFFAYRLFDKDPGLLSAGTESDLHLLGMVAMMDPPRMEAMEAIRHFANAGIKTVMITGDQPLTAKAIAEQLGILSDKQSGVVTGTDLAKVPRTISLEAIRNASVFARITPAQKLEIVGILQQDGREVVAMSGDGVNDAPSLRKADIGIAMGITGSDVSKDIADIILLDDNYSTIVVAVKEGRRIYANIKKFIEYILSSNLAEMLTLFLCPILGLGIPLLPVHILWINLVTDGLPGIALIAEKPEPDLMSLPPRRPDEKILTRRTLTQIICSGGIMTLASIATAWWASRQGYSAVQRNSLVFSVLCFVQLANALSVSVQSGSIFSLRVFSNWRLWGAIFLTVIMQSLIVFVPALQHLFRTSAPDGKSLLYMVCVVSVCLLALEGIKKMLIKPSAV